MRTFVFLIKINFEKNVITSDIEEIFLFDAIIFNFCKLNENVNLINIFFNFDNFIVYCNDINVVE